MSRGETRLEKIFTNDGYIDFYSSFSLYKKIVKIDNNHCVIKDMVKYIDVPRSTITSNVVTISKDIIGKYSNYNTVIPEGSMFYSNVIAALTDADQVAGIGDVDRIVCRSIYII